MLPHPPRRSLDVEHHGVVHEPVEDGGGHHGIAEDLTPLIWNWHRFVWVDMPCLLGKYWSGGDPCFWR